jgi:hypothetical protein
LQAFTTIPRELEEEWLPSPVKKVRWRVMRGTKPAEIQVIGLLEALALDLPKPVACTGRPRRAGVQYEEGAYTELLKVPINPQLLRVPINSSAKRKDVHADVPDGTPCVGRQCKCLCVERGDQLRIKQRLP